ncbi:MAG: ATP-binding cassette domain-containing protein, partial [Proteobacteria bacterium]|nr:ATP-binding cassette domain-containing protein [Pseudomonadota bacterium]
IDALLTQLRAPPPQATIDTLSGGERRRVALARALLEAPEVLIVDEPTNHLDAETVSWLESYLIGYRGAVLLVTHDRYLLEAVADRIVEIEDGEGVAYDGSYGDYLIARAERRANLERSEDSRLKLLAREAVWAARSPAARTGKQRARLQRLDELRNSRPLMKEESFQLDFKTGLKRGGTAIEIQRLSKGYDGKRLIKDLFLSLAPGDRMGVVGPNGCGKSTLLRMLMGDEVADGGEIFSGPRVRLAMLDQERTGLNPDDTVFEAAGGGNDHVFVCDQPIHVAGLLRRFLFGRELLDQSVSKLSGGERARLLLARLLLEGANVLLLDEPTNDLDLQTLRVLEEALLGFDGVALVVTHDRALLDRTCNSILAFEGEGTVTRYASRTQWEAALAKRRAKAQKVQKPKSTKAPRVKKAGLTYAEKRECAELPSKIEELESELAQLEDLLADPATYRNESMAVGELSQRSKGLAAQIEELYGRWAVLEDKAQS